MCAFSSVVALRGAVEHPEERNVPQKRQDHRPVDLSCAGTTSIFTALPRVVEWWFVAVSTTHECYRDCVSADRHLVDHQLYLRLQLLEVQVGVANGGDLVGAEFRLFEPPEFPSFTPSLPTFFTCVQLCTMRTMR